MQFASSPGGPTSGHGSYGPSEQLLSTAMLGQQLLPQASLNDTWRQSASAPGPGSLSPGRGCPWVPLLPKAHVVWESVQRRAVARFLNGAISE